MEFLKTVWATKKGKIAIVFLAAIIVAAIANQIGLTN